MKNRLFAQMISIFFVLGMFATSALFADVPKMTKEELKGLLGNPGLIIVDVRVGREWTGNDLKIKGAVPQVPKNMESWSNKYSEDKTLVLYCA
jgi:hypothetical protein